ncbi:MAG: lipoate-protein ligase B [Hyphomicrobium sp.]|nr:MAG: lipoate-protein ligase B [Hyphomicrobium sp.]PPD01786.1 MAG: lipoate-protein ligase B [Hyphomicrobium sp.]
MTKRLENSGDIEWAIRDDLISYPTALDVMAKRADDIRAHRASELIWLIEHPALYTAGTSSKATDLIEPTYLPVFQSGRGGQYTYHGPGQRIAYVMLDLQKRGNDVRALISNLELWLADTLDAFNIKGQSKPGRIGMWVQRNGKHGDLEQKIAAIGLRVSQGVTTHGISFNVDPDLTHYRGIVPCGIQNYGVTSLADLGRPVTMTDVDIALRASFEENFGRTHSVADPATGRN